MTPSFPAPTLSIRWYSCKPNLLSIYSFIKDSAVLKYFKFLIICLIVQKILENSFILLDACTVGLSNVIELARRPRLVRI